MELSKCRDLWDAHKHEFSALLQIPSVYEQSSIQADAPYGLPVQRALDFMKQLCEREGLIVRDYDGYAISWGEGPRIDIVSHLDVVPVSDGWTEDPFSGSIHDGRVHGRGTQDMKSGAYLSFLAVKALKDAGVVPQCEIRLVYGTDEERTMDDMKYYVKRAGLPAFAYSPDGTFPITNGEKGALMWVMEAPYEGAITSLFAGTQPNVIPSSATATYLLNGELHIVETMGMSAHASRPKDGKSALPELFSLLAAQTNDPLMTRLQNAFADPYGAGVGLDVDLPPMGRLTINPGVVTLSEGTLKLLIDCRYPQGITAEECTKRLKARFPEFNITLPYNDPPTYVSADDPFIRAMQTAYTQVTGNPCGLNISGGVSYSKVFGHCVTFGTVPEGEVSLAHQANESISEEACVSALAIYMETIQALMNVPGRLPKEK